MRAPELFDLKNRCALVTGGGRGLGRHIASGLAEAGAHVILASRKRERCEEAAQAIRQSGGSAEAASLDVSDPESIDALLASVLPNQPHLDILVNNAARVWAAPLLEFPLEGWDRVFNLNIRGLFYLSQSLAGHMRDLGAGSIINISSLNASRGTPDDKEPNVAYNASKGALNALTLDLAIKLAPHGIRVNAIAPGAFRTDMMTHLEENPDALSALTDRIPQKRCGEEDDIKGAAVFLASSASRYVTGQILAVDGGLSDASPFA